MADIQDFTDASFMAEVLKSSIPVVVDFTAEWCGPCKMLAPIVDELNREWNGAVKVGRLDIDANVETTMTYGVMGIPTLILFKDGKPVERLTGFKPKDRIKEAFKPHLP